MAKISDLFLGLETGEIQDFLEKSKAFTEEMEEGDAVFLQSDIPKYLFILQSGAVVVENIDENGKRMVVNVFHEEGTVFGEVYLYIDRDSYDFSCYVQKKARILKIPKSALMFWKEYNEVQQKILNNMLLILSRKSYFLNQKLLMVHSVSLREKLAKYILQNSEGKEVFHMALNRQDLANYLGVARPSLSRELSNMRNDRLIEVKGSTIYFSREKLKNILSR
ncbi:MAG: Crp/Fnr family transcriptional regulator [Tissierellia bacterium]|nr:Crp/Fnr family transcriptional regulator [Tissierellia bacterium]